MQDLTEIKEFLGSETPDAWVKNALENQELMLIDHAHCEKKAATTALNLINRYPHDDQLLHKMSRLAREELRHFEQVLKFIKKRKLRYSNLTASRYASSLREHVRSNEPAKLADILIIGAFIEARSCERFAKIAPHLDQELADFYVSLLKSESRHYQDYLSLAGKYEKKDLNGRIAYFREIENTLIAEADTQFRFHSGPV
jgi:tRNA-(ms[2]io[6]A)-hydroxylase